MLFPFCVAALEADVKLAIPSSSKGCASGDMRILNSDNWDFFSSQAKYANQRISMSFKLRMESIYDCRDSYLRLSCLLFVAVIT